MFFEAVNVGDLQDKVVDEWTYAELLEPDVYRNRMLGHWSTFVVRSHFQELATAGISHVRCVINFTLAQTICTSKQNPSGLLVLGCCGWRTLSSTKYE